MTAQLLAAPPLFSGLAATGMLLLGATLAADAVTSRMRGTPFSTPPITTYPTVPAAPPTEAPSSIRLLTLNMAHGRATGPNQMLQKTSAIRANLARIAALVNNQAPDVVALQESDGPSLWTGRMDQVGYLACMAEYPYSVHGDHVDGLGLAYGTALLSRLPLRDAVSVTFPPSPMPSKGFVVSTITLGPGNQAVDVVSVHLDFASHLIRRQQVATLAEVVRERQRPVIIMGDFNCEWTPRRSVVRRLAGELQLVPYEPTAPDSDTFLTLPRRLDWFLISPQLEFRDYRVIPDPVSDHLAVVCEIGLREAPATTE